MYDRDSGTLPYNYRTDLGPTNVITSDDGHLSNIWESAGYFPCFQIGTKPRIIAGSISEGLKDERWT